MTTAGGGSVWKPFSGTVAVLCRHSHIHGMADIRNRLDELELLRKRTRDAQIERDRRKPAVRGRTVGEIKKIVWRLPTKPKSDD